MDLGGRHLRPNMTVLSVLTHGHGKMDEEIPIGHGICSMVDHHHGLPLFPDAHSSVVTDLGNFCPMGDDQVVGVDHDGLLGAYPEVLDHDHSDRLVVENGPLRFYPVLRP